MALPWSTPCPYCLKKLRNKQAVRRHFRDCENYIRLKAAGLIVPKPKRLFAQCLDCGRWQTRIRICKGCGGKSFGPFQEVVDGGRRAAS